MTPTTWVAFLVAAGLGAPARYLVDAWVRARAGHESPWGTWVVNVTGCLVLGLLTGLGLYHGLGTPTRLAVGTGGLGAYTTFSTFTFETMRLYEEGRARAAVANVAGSILLGLLAAAAGLAVMAAW